MATIDIKPQILDLSLYAGDGVKFRLICTDSGNAPIPITGTVEAQVRIDREPGSDPIVEFTANLDESGQGIVALSLTGDQTQQLMADPSTVKGKFTGVWDVQWTPTDEEARTLCQGKVECVADVTR